MRLFPLAMALCGLTLAACTDADWDHALTYTGIGDERIAAADPVPGAQPMPVQPMPVQAVQTQAAAPDTSFCEAVAKQDATSDGFDAPTRQRLFQRSFQQCLVMFGGGLGPQGAVAANSR